MWNSSAVRRACFVAVVPFICFPSPARAQSTTLTAVAAFEAAGGANAQAPLLIEIRQFASEADRNELIKLVNESGTPAARTWLAARPDVGTVQIGAHQMPIKYAFQRATSAGQLYTVMTSEPMTLTGAAQPASKPGSGFDVGLILIEVAAGPGHGELIPAAKVRVDKDGAIVTEAGQSGMVPLSDVIKK
jgi:hypothetical protein